MLLFLYYICKTSDFSSTVPRFASKATFSKLHVLLDYIINYQASLVKIAEEPFLFPFPT